MQEPYQWYVLYVKNKSEKRVVTELAKYVARKNFDCAVEPFCPESEIYYRGGKDRQLGRTYLKRPLFPNYVFVETQMQSERFLRDIGEYAYASSDIIRILRNGDSDNIALPDTERMRLEYLLRGKRYIEHSVGLIEGDKITVEAGPLKGHEGLIKRVNRHNRIATVELDMFGGKITAQVALEIVSKTE